GKTPQCVATDSSSGQDDASVAHARPVKSGAVQLAPAARSSAGACAVVSPTTAMPARRAASTPTTASSNTTQAAGGTPRRAAAVRYTSGSGLPRRTSPAVTWIGKAATSPSPSRIRVALSGTAEVAMARGTPASARARMNATTPATGAV